MKISLIACLGILISGCSGAKPTHDYVTTPVFCVDREDGSYASFFGAGVSVEKMAEYTYIEQGPEESKVIIVNGITFNSNGIAQDEALCATATAANVRALNKMLIASNTNWVYAD